MAMFIPNYYTHTLVFFVLIGAFCVCIYLLLRPLFLWYFKIYSIVSELKENNALLREILDELRNKDIQTPASTKQPKEDYSKYMPR